MSDLAHTLTNLPDDWTSGNPNFCEWSGVTCDAGRVTAINLPERSFSGLLPDSISQLPSLRSISLHRNQISGLLPSFGGSVSQGYSSPGDDEDDHLGSSAHESTFPAAVVVGSIISVLVIGGCVAGFLYHRQHKKKHPKQFGYLAPEYALTGKVNAFVVILMELITGRKVLDESLGEEDGHLVMAFRRNINNKGKFMSTVDASLDLDEEAYESVLQVSELSCHCTDGEPNQRPTMGYAVQASSPSVDQCAPINSHYQEDPTTTLTRELAKWQSGSDMAAQALSPSVDQRVHSNSQYEEDPNTTLTPELSRWRSGSDITRELLKWQSGSDTFTTAACWGSSSTNHNSKR